MPANMRLRTLLDSEVQSSDDATRILDLPKSGALHSLQVRMRCTNGATSGLDVSIYDVVDLIEVVADGSRVLHSLIPEVSEKRYEARRGRGIPMVQNNRAAAVQELTVPIEFGRWFYDPEMWLPLNRFNDLKLRVQFSPVISATVGFATGTFTLDVLGLISPETPPVYMGTLVTRNINNFTSAASGDDTTELHLGQVLRDVNIYAYEAAIADGVDITDVELRADDGGFSYFNNNWNELIDLNALWYESDIEHNILTFMNDNDTLDTRISVPDHFSLGDETAAVVGSNLSEHVAVDTIAGDRLTFNVSEIDATAGSETHTTQTTRQPVAVNVGKKEPSYNVLLPFDWSDDPNTWLNTRELSRLQLLLTQGAAGADTRVSTCEVHQF